MLIKHKEKKILPIHQLSRQVLRFIYEEDKMSLSEIEYMQQSINKWVEIIKLDKERRQERNARLFIIETVHETEEELALQEMGNLLYRKEKKDPKLMRRIAQVKSGLLNWKKFHRLPDAYDKESRIKALKNYEKYKEKNKEQEDMGNAKKTN